MVIVWATLVTTITAILPRPLGPGVIHINTSLEPRKGRRTVQGVCCRRRFMPLPAASSQAARHFSLRRDTIDGGLQNPP